jgi:hypothetical protein
MVKRAKIAVAANFLLDIKILFRATWPNGQTIVPSLPLCQKAILKLCKKDILKSTKYTGAVSNVYLAGLFSPTGH